jgi:ElaB/YqjD/DUF883 family membrane-anchored ribosome-binding protein
MGFETSAREQAAAFAGSRTDELSPLLAWLSNPKGYAPARQSVARSPTEQLISDACGHIRRHPLQAVALAAAGGFIAGMLWDARIIGRRP